MIGPCQFRHFYYYYYYYHHLRSFGYHHLLCHSLHIKKKESPWRAEFNAAFQNGKKLNNSGKRYNRGQNYTNISSNHHPSSYKELITYHIIELRRVWQRCTSYSNIYIYIYIYRKFNVIFDRV